MLLAVVLGVLELEADMPWDAEDSKAARDRCNASRSWWRRPEPNAVSSMALERPEETLAPGMRDSD